MSFSCFLVLEVQTEFRVRLTGNLPLIETCPIYPQE